MFNDQNNYFAFDFDGVIADSIHECMISGYNAFSHIHNTAKRRFSVDEFTKYERNEFRRLRNFIRSGEDYVYIMFSSHIGLTIQNQADWDSFVSQYSNLKDQYYSEFYASRNSILQQFKEKWLALNPLYPGIKKILKTIPADHIFIVTTKDITFVKEILEANDIQLKNNQMFQAVKGIKKPHIIRTILSEYSLEKDHLHFIDDHAQTVLDVSETDIPCHLAAWGYNSPEQQKKLKQENISILQLSDLTI